MDEDNFIEIGDVYMKEKDILNLTNKQGVIDLLTEKNRLENRVGELYKIKANVESSSAPGMFFLAYFGI